MRCCDTRVRPPTFFQFFRNEKGEATRKYQKRNDRGWLSYASPATRHDPSAQHAHCHSERSEESDFSFPTRALHGTRNMGTRTTPPSPPRSPTFPRSPRTKRSEALPKKRNYYGPLATHSTLPGHSDHRTRNTRARTTVHAAFAPGPTSAEAPDTPAICLWRCPPV
jgi:hypothetical protein